MQHFTTELIYKNRKKSDLDKRSDFYFFKKKLTIFILKCVFLAILEDFCKIMNVVLYYLLNLCN